MSYRVVQITELMAYEFGHVEGGFNELIESELKAVIPSGMEFKAFMEQLRQGHLVLLTDSPSTPMLLSESGAMGSGNTWALNPQATNNVEPAAQSALLDRTRMSESSAGYSRSQNLYPPLPMPTYIPEPPLPDYSDEPPKLKYEYSFEITCSQDSVRKVGNCHFILANTKNEVELGRWVETKTEHGTRYTILTAFDEPKQLVAQVASRAMGVSPTHLVKVRSIGTQVADEGFIPVTPSVQLGERLGFPTEGFYYHFHDCKLVQEYRLLGDKRWDFYATLSSHQSLDPERGYNTDQSAILVFWKLGGKVIENQYLVYLQRQITRDELDNLTEEWLNEHGVKLDIPQLLEATKHPIIKRTVAEKPAEQKQPEPLNHIVQTDPETGSRETWAKIAKQYGLAPKALLGINPQYDADPMSLSVGDSLNVQKSQPQRIEKESVYEIPPESPKRFNQPLNTYYEYTDHYLANTSVVSISNERLVEKDIPVVNLKKVEEKILRIGVFFDGTGQNHLNDLYKETRGVKSRTNVARLFEIYPLDDNSNAIYVAGVGTVDGAWQTPTLIDEGKDEVDLAQAFGVSPNNLEKTSTFIDVAYNLVADETGAFYKWQNWTKQYFNIIQNLKDNQLFQDITHIEFDVFGFSRGAALARHFVNAVKDGLPDYDKPRDGEAFGEVFPNLLSHQEDISSQPKHGYYPDETRTCSVRFLGLFDTVGSFYLAGNNDEGNFELGLDTSCAERVFQISAHHEYRKNFPLTSLLPSDGILPPNFYEEVFAGCHTDIGGGYPSKEQYAKQGLPERYGMPLSATYNRELIKTESIREEIQAQQNVYGAAAYSERLYKHAQDAWNLECRTKGLYGVVTLVNGILYYYELQPISNALSALPLERMKQQAKKMGIQWAREVEYPSDFIQLTGNDVALDALNEKLLAQPLGSIAAAHWQDEISQYGKEWIHRPHDALISAGCETAKDSIVNAVTKEGNQLKRVVFDNEV
ncbi:DUF2235 domain-containing protein [Vibrio rotiferianus]|uniref:DUF2235 domain-containing protein n=1 Tax=Vibrio rotiferianus TaxID=190895 RepID=A0A7Y3Z7T3_9VIBR|nr:DUF2235 domain-containing protein [Vibrio rotiferianus]NOH48066.1 DUF2235 domain-containing protein [Vibrio rotiferianus]